MRKIILCGELGKRFGRVHRYEVSSPAECIKALCATLKGFKKFVQSSHERRVGYRALRGKEELEPKQLCEPIGKSEVFKIVPVFMGASAVGRIIGGALLIAVGAVLSFTPFAGASPYLYYAGTSLIVGGVAGLLTPIPKANVKENEGARPQSTGFNGPVNTSSQGQPVPLLFGRMIIGSHVISARITTWKTTIA